MSTCIACDVIFRQVDLIAQGFLIVAVESMLENEFNFYMPFKNKLK